MTEHAEKPRPDIGFRWLDFERLSERNDRVAENVSAIIKPFSQITDRLSQIDFEDLIENIFGTEDTTDE